MSQLAARRQSASQYCWQAHTGSGPQDESIPWGIPVSPDERSPSGRSGFIRRLLSAKRDPQPHISIAIIRSGVFIIPVNSSVIKNLSPDAYQIERFRSSPIDS